MSLNGKVAIVIGGSRGIGRAIALRLGQEGASVIVNFAHREEDAAATVALLRERHAEAEMMRADIGDLDQIRTLFRGVKERFGRLDILVNNAARGLERPRDAIKGMPQHLKRTFDVNLFGPWFCAQEAARLMTGGGRIINLSSLGAHRYGPRYAAVGVSKAALESLTVYLAVELAPQGITVNTVSGGLVEGTEGIKMFPPAVQAAVRRQTPAGRLVLPEDIAGVVAFLCSDDAAMICGQTITVDGGYSLTAWPSIDAPPQE